MTVTLNWCFAGWLCVLLNYLQLILANACHLIASLSLVTFALKRFDCRKINLNQVEIFWWTMSFHCVRLLKRAHFSLFLSFFFIHKPFIVLFKRIAISWKLSTELSIGNFFFKFLTEKQTWQWTVEVLLPITQRILNEFSPIYQKFWLCKSLIKHTSLIQRFELFDWKCTFHQRKKFISIILPLFYTFRLFVFG